MTQIIPSRGGGGGVGLYKYMGTVDYYEDLPSSGMKVGDTYNVVNAHTTAPEFPAGANLAWNGEEWDVLGGTFDLSEYQKKLVEGDGIDIDQDTNGISVESSIIEGAAAGATAVQPGDNVSTLTNDAGYIDNTVDDLTNYTKTSDLAAVALSNDYDDLIDKPTIGNATLTIQRNGTQVNTFTANATSNVTANISVPTKTSDITNDSGFIDKDVNNLTNYTLTTSLASVATSGSYNDLSNKPSIPTKTSDLTNDSGFIDKDVNDLTNYTLSSDLASVATSGSYNDLSNKPTIGTANLTVQKNGTTVATFGANATSGVTANITVPTKVTDLSDGGDYVKSASLATVATSGSYNDLSNKPTIPGVINNLTSTSTTDALSAAQGKALKDALDNISGLGKFLSLWDSTTGQPISFPLATPYTYTTGDWFMVETVGTTNYKPSGSSYTGTASTTVESGAVKQGDVYIYDGTAWLLQVNNEPQVSFSEIAGQPTDNTNLATALGAKQDVSNMVTTLTGADNTHYPTAKAVADALSGAGNGDMLKATYDPDNVEANAFDYNNFINTPNLAAVATSGSYSDLSNTPSLAAVATSGSYNDLSNKPTIPTVNNATLTIQKNGTTVKTFTANASSDVTANISVPTKTSDITNDSGYITKSVNNLDNYTLSSALATVATTGSYSDLSNKPTIPTDTSDLTNGAGFITGITSGDVTAALGYTPYNSSNPSGYVTSSIINNTAYASSWNGDTTHAPTKDAVYDKIYTMDNAINGKMPGFSLNIGHATAGNPREVKFVTVNYGNMTQYGAAYFRLSAASCHPDGGGYNYMVDIYIGCTYQGVVKCNIIKYVQSSVDQYNPGYEGGGKYFGDVFYVVDTDAKKVYFYILGGQYTSSDFTPAIKIGSTSLTNVQQHSGTGTYYDTGTKVWANGCGSLVAIKSDIPTKVSQLTNDSGFITDSYHDSTKQDKLIAGTNIQIAADGKTISATDTTYTAGSGISISDGVISTTQASPVWGNITGTLSDQTDLQTALSAKANDNSVVHLSGAETIVDGLKVFESDNDPAPTSGSVTTSITLKGKNLKKGGTAGYKYTSIDFKDQDDALVAKFSGLTTPDGWSGFMAGAGSDPTSTIGNLWLIANNSSNQKLLLIPPTTGHNYGAVRYDYYNNNTVRLSTDQTIAGTKTFSTSPVVPSKSTDAGNNATTIATEAQVYKKQDTLVSGTNIKTINNTSLLGSGNIDIQSGGNYTAGEGIVIGTIHSDMQGPAPDGFHVPLGSEWDDVKTIWTTLGGGSSDGDNFRIALKLPFVGYRSSSSADVNDQDSRGYYWSSSRNTTFSAYAMFFGPTDIYPQTTNNRASGLSVRCFKDTPTIPTSSWTKLYGTSIESGGIFWNSTDGLISLSSDGTTWITIADKNLGATSVWNSGDTLSEANCGKYYQRGNNYGFPRTGTIANQSTTQVDASAYGPGNYYSSDTFIKYSGRWDSTDNGNLWGGVTQGTWVGEGNTITNTGVLSVNGQTGNVTIESGGITNDTTGTTSTVTKIRAGSEAEYNALSSKDATTIYHVY